MVGRQIHRPHRLEQIGHDDVLLGLGSSAQLGARATPLEQHCGGVVGEVVERVDLGRAVASERREPLRLVQRLGVLPRHLEHHVASVGVGARRDPRAVAAGLERFAELEPPACRQLLHPLRQRGQPRHPRRSAHVGRGLQVGRYAQPRSQAGTASITRIAEPVAMTWLSPKPPRSRRSSNSSIVRSMPPGPTSMLRSESLSSAPRFGGAISRSIEQEDGLAADRRTARLEDADRLLVVPVVHDGLEHVRVAAAWDAVEEAAADDLASIGDAHLREKLRGMSHDVWLIEQHTPSLCIGAQDVSQERAVPATDVHDSTESTEVIRGDDRSAELRRQTDHRPVEDVALVRVVGAVVPRTHPVRESKRVLSGPHAVAETSPRLPLRRSPHEGSPCLQRGVCV